MQVKQKFIYILFESLSLGQSLFKQYSITFILTINTQRTQYCSCSNSFERRKALDHNTILLPKIKTEITISAVDKGKLPKPVMDDILLNLSPSDNKEEAAEKVRKGNSPLKFSDQFIKYKVNAT